MNGRSLRAPWSAMPCNIAVCFCLSALLGCGGGNESELRLRFRGSESFGRSSLLSIQIDAASQRREVLEPEFARTSSGNLGAGPYPVPAARDIRISARLLSAVGDTSTAELLIPARERGTYGVDISVGRSNPALTCFGCAGFAAAEISGSADSLYLSWSLLGSDIAGSGF